MGRFYATDRAAFGPPFFSTKGFGALYCAGFLLCAALFLPASAFAESFSAYAKAVLDGDTVILDSGTVVRVLGVDAPEIAHEGKTAQYYGQEAKSALAGMVMGKILHVEVPDGKRDRYGRALGVIFTDGDVSINEALVADGAAFYYWHRDVPKDLAERLVVAQRRSIKRGKGFWPKIAALPRPAAPYLGNSRSWRFHAPGCPLGAKISKKNRVAFATALDAFSAGYSPARPCTPWPPAGR